MSSQDFISTHDNVPFDWKDRLRASAIHLCISLAIALLAALLVFLVWYPNPYREISGGRELFLILVTVDVILGPLITLAIFNRNKRWQVLRRDLTVVGLLQLAALAYGMWTVFIVRPAHLVFEFDRFRVIHTIEVPAQMLAQAPAGLETLPLFGPTMLAVRPFKNPEEYLEATMKALEGLHLSARPDLWQFYEDAIPRVLEAAAPIANLKKRFPGEAERIDREIARTGRSLDALVYLPLVGRDSFWTALLDSSSAEVVGFVPLDSF